MNDNRLLECLAADYSLLRKAAAAGDPAAPVPSCPGWSAADLLTHITAVYMHKTVTMRTGSYPDPWDPDLSGEPLAVLDAAYGALTAEFAARPADSPALTWYEPDQSVGFWIRRMAHESVIHRVDAELAAGLPVTPIPADLAADGVDEVLTAFLAYEAAQSPEEFAAMEGGHLAGPEGEEAIVVRAGEREWTVRPAPTSVRISEGGVEAPRALVAGEPAEVLLWMWGRGGGVEVAGDPAWAAYLRRMLVLVTQ
ncbi:maleylpyruvate isomerase family mycothiol-dependent enzyme [Nonomuraea dietziae]|uniref:maleylpyruvate isomerase family mycothiol-dependent enzyme n=1 Tax=Nonomuraea dietziae TaxID=65515 RepID=UPI00341805F8